MKTQSSNLDLNFDLLFVNIHNNMVTEIPLICTIDQQVLKYYPQTIMQKVKSFVLDKKNFQLTSKQLSKAKLCELIPI